MSVFHLQSRKAKIIWLSVIGVISYCLFLVANMPADKVWHAFSGKNIPVQLYGITGTPWSGSVENVVIQNGKRPVVLPQIHWQLTLPELFLGRIKLDLVMGDASSEIEGHGSVTLTTDTLTLDSVKVHTTPAWLIAATGGQIPGNLSGNVSVDLKQATLTNQGCASIAGQAKMTNSQFSSLLGRLDLGSATADLSCDNRELVAKLSQQSPLFSASGEFRAGVHGRYTTTGLVKPGTAMSVQIRQGLMLLGSPDNNGAYSLNFNGRLF